MRFRTLLFGLAVSATMFGSFCEFSLSQEEGKRGTPGGTRGGSGSDRGAWTPNWLQIYNPLGSKLRSSVAWFSCRLHPA